MPKKGFEFQFKNPVQDSGDALTNVLFINDTPSESDILRLELATVPDVTLTLNPVDSGDVSDSNHHFKLTCRPDKLARPEEILLDASHAALWGMICIPETVAAGAGEERAPGDIDFYFLYKGDSPLEVNTDNPLSLTLRKVGAVSEGGTRPTITQVTLNKRETDFDKFVLLAGPGGDYNLTENANLDLVAPRGLSAPTLMAGFVSSDIVLNDGDTESYLLLRIVNTGELPISLSPEGSASPSKLTLRFAADNTTSRLWALGTISQVSSILIPGKSDSSATDPNWPGKDAWTVTPRANEQRWTLTPKAGKTTLEPDEAIEVPISKIVTGHATGRTALRIGYSGLPGFGDGELVAFIQKYPLVYAGPKVGVGTDSPSEKLTVETAANSDGITHTDGTIKLTTTVDTGGAALGTRSEHDLRFFTNGNTKVTLTTDGDLGIGTREPTEKLHVEGNLRVNGDFKNWGPFTFRANTDQNPAGEDLARFMDKDNNQVLTLNSDGMLGVGTTSPSEKLHVDGHLRVNGDFKKGPGPFVFWANTDKVPNADLLRLHDGNGNRVLTVVNDGKLIVGGSETSNIEKLHVKGDLRVDRDLKKGSGPFVLWANTDKVAGADLLRIMDKDGNQALTVNAEGRLWLKKKPMEVWTAKLGSAENVRSPYSAADWIPVLAGFTCYAKDDPNDKDTSFYCRPYEYQGFWHIHGWHRAGHNEWTIQVIFIQRDLVEGGFSY